MGGDINHLKKAREQVLVVMGNVLMEPLVLFLMSLLGICSEI